MKYWLSFLTAVMLAAAIYNITAVGNSFLAIALGMALGGFFVLAVREPA